VAVSLTLSRVLIHERQGERGVLFAEPSDALRAEDVGREEHEHGRPTIRSERLRFSVASKARPFGATAGRALERSSGHLAFLDYAPSGAEHAHDLKRRPPSAMSRTASLALIYVGPTSLGRAYNCENGSPDDPERSG
jgi:hypothetical protein